MLKTLDRASKVAFCPSSKYGVLFASGTIAGTIDDSFESNSQLEIFDANLSDPTNNLKNLGSVTSKDCFHSIAWGAKGMEDNGALRYGLVAGGMSDGSINIWNVDAIVSGRPHSLVSRSDTHKGQVMGLEFHPKLGNLLASGATDGETLIWDLANLSSPAPSRPTGQPLSSLPPGMGGSGVTTVAWNKKVGHIIASANENGQTSIFDLRQKRAIVTLRHSGRANVRTTALSWNPDASVVLAMSYAGTPVAEVWDLRKQMQPKMKLQGGHSGGIVGLDWCPHDPDLILTSGDDGRVLIWNANSGQLLSDYPSFRQSGGHVHYDVKWCPTLPSLVSSCNDEGRVSLMSVQGAGVSHAPKWLARPAGVAFGFGGRLAYFANEEFTQSKDEVRP